MLKGVGCVGLWKQYGVGAFSGTVWWACMELTVSAPRQWGGGRGLWGLVWAEGSYLEQR